MFNVIDDFSLEAFDRSRPQSCSGPHHLDRATPSNFLALAEWAEWAEWAECKGIALDFTEPGRPMQNGFIERFNGS